MIKVILFGKRLFMVTSINLSKKFVQMCLIYQPINNFTKDSCSSWLSIEKMSENNMRGNCNSTIVRRKLA